MLGSRDVRTLPHKLPRIGRVGAHEKIGAVTIPNVLAARYASTELVTLVAGGEGTGRAPAVAGRTARAGRPRGAGAGRCGRGVRGGGRRRRPGVDRRAGAGHPARREGAHRGVLGARRHEQIHKGMTSRDLTENVEQLQIRASLDADPRPGGRRAGPAGRARGRVRRPGHGRPVAQRTGPGHHARQTLRERGRGTADRVRADRRAARPLPVARHQGPGRHGRRPARPVRR